MNILLEKSKQNLSRDKRTWADIMEKYPHVRDLLYTSENLFKHAAVGASDKLPWHKSLLYLTTIPWEEDEANAVKTLLTNFLNRDFD